MVFSLYDECKEIWAGSPAVHCIQNGIQSSFSTPNTSGENLDLESGKDYDDNTKGLEEETLLEEDASLETRPEPSETATKDYGFSQKKPSFSFEGKEGFKALFTLGFHESRSLLILFLKG